MNFVNLKTWMIALVLLLSTQAQAGSLFTGSDNCGPVYIEASQECFHHGGGVIFHHFRVSTPNGRGEIIIRANRDECDREAARTLVGKSVFVSLRSRERQLNSYEVTNYQTFADLSSKAYPSLSGCCSGQASPCSNCTTAVSPCNGCGVQFENDFSTSDLQLRVTGSAPSSEGTSSDAAIPATGARVKLKLDIYRAELQYFNSRGNQAFTQNLSRNEVENFHRVLGTASSSCPVDITISGSLRKVIKVKSSCTDLGHLNGANNFG